MSKDTFDTYLTSIVNLVYDIYEAVSGDTSIARLPLNIEQINNKLTEIKNIVSLPSVTE